MILRHPKAPLVVGILIIVGLAAYVTVYRSSPGELSRPHAAIAGSSFITDCNKCHAEKDVTPGCLGCHAEIKTQLDQKKGLHPFLLKDKPVTCARCHSEHNGSEFALISAVSWEGKDPKTFTHPHVNFGLTGAHAKLACARCHDDRKHPAFTLARFPKNPRVGSYLGLSQSCIACHADPHAGGRASACASCHTQDRWKPAPNFNHDKFFPLKGSHAGVSCSQCHAPAKKALSAADSPLKIFGPVKGKRCMDCHATPHRTDWKKSCETCHRADQPWSRADQKVTHDLHSLTGFRLAQPHQRAACASCHAPGHSYAQRYPRPGRMENRCESCHRDTHQGQFTAKHPHCTDCHGLLAFKPTQFTTKDHGIYPLVGGHLPARCNDCHTVTAQSTVRRFVGTPRDCASCHRDVHVGQFRQNGVTRCESCHSSTVTWKKLVFNHNQQSRFKLDQAHKNVACQDCHPRVALKNGVQITQYKPLRMQCKDCHDFER